MHFINLFDTSSGILRDLSISSLIRLSLVLSHIQLQQVDCQFSIGQKELGSELWDFFYWEALVGVLVEANCMELHEEVVEVDVRSVGVEEDVRDTVEERLREGFGF